VRDACDMDGKGRRVWHELKGRELVPLAVKPEAWQPENPETWIWPNGVVPEPLPVRVMPQLSVVGGLDYDAVAASEEREADRQAAIAAHGRPEPEAGQFWRDVSLIAYEPMGAVSLRMGEARIMRALVVERSIRMDMRLRYRTNAAVLADIKRTLADVLAEAPQGDWCPPISATPEDWRDFDTVMGWLVEVMPSKRELFVMRCRMLSPPATWVQIGDEIRRDGKSAKRMYDRSIGDLVDAANRRPRRARARLAELKERNREAAR